MINISHNFPLVARAISGLADELQRKVLARTLNRTIEQARTAMSSEIRSTYALSAAYVRQRLRIKRATFKGASFSLQAELIGGDGKRRSANIIAFSARQVGRGVSVKVRKDGGRKVVKGAFIANKGRTVFAREGRARLPIKPVQTIDVPQMFNARRVNAAVIAAINGRFPAIFERELKYALTQRGLA